MILSDCFGGHYIYFCREFCSLLLSPTPKSQSQNNVFWDDLSDNVTSSRGIPAEFDAVNAALTESHYFRF